MLSCPKAGIEPGMKIASGVFSSLGCECSHAHDLFHLVAVTRSTVLQLNWSTYVRVSLSDSAVKVGQIQPTPNAGVWLSPSDPGE